MFFLKLYKWRGKCKQKLFLVCRYLLVTYRGLVSPYGVIDIWRHDHHMASQSHSELIQVLACCLIRAERLPEPALSRQSNQHIKVDVLKQKNLVHRFLSLHKSSWVNPFWPGDAIWGQRSWPKLFQVVMACCLTAPSHYLNQCWFTLTKSSGIHSRVMFTGIFQKSILRLSLKFAHLKSQPHPPRDKELTLCVLFFQREHKHIFTFYVIPPH